jgi:hypothetical protein
MNLHLQYTVKKEDEILVGIERGGEKGKGIGIREGMERWEGFRASPRIYSKESIP